MEYKDFLADFARRTLTNLEHIRRLEQNERDQGIQPECLTAFPVTQQVNSLLGLVVFPREGYEQHIPDKTIAELLGEGWPKLTITHPNPMCSNKTPRCERNHRECKTLTELIRVLRNGVSHFNIQFEADPNSHEITFIEVSNRCTCCNQITTTIRLSTDQVKEIAERYAQLIIKHARNHAVLPEV